MVPRQEMMAEWRQLFCEEIIDLPECYVGHDDRLLQGLEPPAMLVDVDIPHLGKRKKRHDVVRTKACENSLLALQSKRLRAMLAASWS